jgi:hypothetical protein
MPIPLFTPIITASIGAMVAWVLRFITIVLMAKLFILTLIVTILPLVLYKLWLTIQGWMLSELMTRAGGIVGDAPNITVPLAGLAAWAGDLMNIPQAVAVLVSATITGFTLRILFR